jgi:ribosomal-protein-serine acetyltransferase
MFFRKLNQEIKLSLTISQYADEIFTLVDENRDHLKQWMPWLDSVKKVEDTRQFVDLQLSKFQKGEALHETIFYQNRVAGVLGFNRINSQNKVGQIGYWLGKKFTGRGIVTLAVNDLLKLGFEYLSLQKVEIHCAVKNKKSRAIPERLGFKNEGVIRQAELVAGNYLDHTVYGLLKREFTNNHPVK